jgi:hypothetical protein
MGKGFSGVVEEKVKARMVGVEMTSLRIDFFVLRIDFFFDNNWRIIYIKRVVILLRVDSCNGHAVSVIRW